MSSSQYKSLRQKYQKQREALQKQSDQLHFKLSQMLDKFNHLPDDIEKQRVEKIGSKLDLSSYFDDPIDDHIEKLDEIHKDLTSSQKAVNTMKDTLKDIKKQFSNMGNSIKNFVKKGGFFSKYDVNAQSDTRNNNNNDSNTPSLKG